MNYFVVFIKNISDNVNNYVKIDWLFSKLVINSDRLTMLLASLYMIF